MIRSLLVLTLAFVQTTSAYDAQLAGPGLDVALISESRSITPGVPLTIGFHIHHHAGFHTYWKNPGMVGVPTSLEWKLPQGFTASEIRWPYPENTFMAEYPCHGYERDVTLLVTLTPPAKIETKTVTLKVDANWMCCARGCFPNFQSFELTLPVTRKPIPDPHATALINTASKEIPKTNPKLISSVRGHQQIELKLSSLAIPKSKKVYFFSSDGQVSSDQPQEISRGTDGSLILTMPRSEFSPKKIKSLPGVLKIGKQFFKINPAYPGG
ncbi:protein-disulfide reductase DsbD family protein [bacterium]|mgnify:FL=1|nr:protein-disulfide reductase DsbD family protein [bacterium]